MNLIPTIEPTYFKKFMMSYYDQMLFDKKHYDHFLQTSSFQPVYELKLPILPHRQTVHYLIIVWYLLIRIPANLHPQLRCKVAPAWFTDLAKISLKLTNPFLTYSSLLKKSILLSWKPVKIYFGDF